MIHSIGTDLVENERVKYLYERYEGRFAKKILSKSELEDFEKLTLSQKIKKMCSSFAAKEALVKALGTGFRGIYPPDISVIKNNLGKPDLSFNNSAYLKGWRVKNGPPKQGEKVATGSVIPNSVPAIFAV